MTLPRWDKSYEEEVLRMTFVSLRDRVILGSNNQTI